MESCTASFRRASKLESDERGDFHVRIVRSDVSVHEQFDERRLLTPTWTSGGEMPGKLIATMEDQRARVFYENDVPADEPASETVTGRPTGVPALEAQLYAVAC
jgi:hypothetical protein